MVSEIYQAAPLYVDKRPGILVLTESSGFRCRGFTFDTMTDTWEIFLHSSM